MSSAQGPQSAVKREEITPSHTSRGYTLRVTTREVVVEIVARNRENHPVSDLTESDFQVFEGDHKNDAHLRPISGFRVIDPGAQVDQTTLAKGAVVLPLGGRCEIRSTVHYELAFHPASWTSGIHTIRVVTNRKHVNLSYRAEFYVGVQEVRQADPPVSREKLKSELASAACYHGSVPPSILLDVTQLDSLDPHLQRYEFRIPPESLKLAGIDEGSHQLQLEFGICTFSRSGNILGSWQTSLNLAVSDEQLSTILDRGWQEVINIPRKGIPALSRVVVLEPRSGNVGMIDLVTGTHQTENKIAPVDSRRQRLYLPENDEDERVGSHLSLGSIVPAPGAFCGDVYELPTTTTLLPSDFRALNSVGAVFTDSFNVPERALGHGLPGSTSRSEWFGVDYYGEFWVTTPGKYDFVLAADDGADLYIDDHLLINDDGIHPPRTITKSIELTTGRHTIHLPYFEGPTYVSLILQVKPPNGILDVFDIRDYRKPSPPTPHDVESSPKDGLVVR